MNYNPVANNQLLIKHPNTWQHFTPLYWGLFLVIWLLITVLTIPSAYAAKKDPKPTGQSNSDTIAVSNFPENIGSESKKSLTATSQSTHPTQSNSLISYDYIIILLVVACLTVLSVIAWLLATLIKNSKRHEPPSAFISVPTITKTTEQRLASRINTEHRQALANKSTASDKSWQTEIDDKIKNLQRSHDDIDERRRQLEAQQLQILDQLDRLSQQPPLPKTLQVSQLSEQIQALEQVMKYTNKKLGELELRLQKLELLPSQTEVATVSNTTSRRASLPFHPSNFEQLRNDNVPKIQDITAKPQITEHDIINIDSEQHPISVLEPHVRPIPVVHTLPSVSVPVPQTPSPPKLEPNIGLSNLLETLVTLKLIPDAKRASLERLGDVQEIITRVVTDFMPTNRPMSEFRSYREAISRSTGERIKLIVPAEGERVESDQHHIIGSRTVSKGALGCVVEIVRPGIQVGAEIIRKAEIIESR